MKAKESEAERGQIIIKDKEAEIDADGIHYRDLNSLVKRLSSEGIEKFILKNVYGQRYIGSGVRKPVKIEIMGVPGNDLGAFMDGPEIRVHANAQDAMGNTMNSGRIIINGRAGDITAMGMRGGEIYIRGGVGYRAAIHMKEYVDKNPVLVIGGTAQDFLGEYMAGGIVIVLDSSESSCDMKLTRHIGTGMHGGIIYSRYPIQEHQLGTGVKMDQANDEDILRIKEYIERFAELFDENAKSLLNSNFIRLTPVSSRPFSGLYAY